MPLLSWHHSSWDTEPDIRGVPHVSALSIADYGACSWPQAGPGVNSEYIVAQCELGVQALQTQLIGVNFKLAAVQCDQTCIHMSAELVRAIMSACPLLFLQQYFPAVFCLTLPLCSSTDCNHFPSLPSLTPFTSPLPCV